MIDATADILLPFVIRVRSLRDTARVSGPELYDSSSHPAHHIVWSVACEVSGMDPEAEPNPVVLESLVRERCSEAGADPEHALTLLAEAFSVPPKLLSEKVGRKFLDQAQTEVTKKNWLNKFSSLYSQRDIEEFLSGAAEEAGRLRNDQPTLTRPFLEPGKYMENSRKHPTGVPVIDEIAHGGFERGLLVGILAPTGGGKTTLAMNILTGQAKRRKHCLLLSYEQSMEGDLMERMMTNMLGLPVDTFRGKHFRDLPGDVQALHDKVGAEYGQYMHVADFSKAGNEALSGLEDIQRHVDSLSAMGCKPDYVVLDWFWPMLKLYLNKKGVVSEDSALAIPAQGFMADASKLAKKLDVTLVLFHQLNTEANKRSARAKPCMADAQYFGGFGNMTDCCLVLGKRDATTSVNWLVADKLRRGAKGEVMIRLIGNECRFQTADDVVADHRGQFVPRDRVMPDYDARMNAGGLGAYNV